jgi:hypothetical protein
MASVRIRGIIEKNHITIEGKMSHDIRKKIDQILAS